MRKALALLPALALLSACIDIPQAPKRDAVRSPVSAAFTPRPEVRQCLADLSITRASFTRCRTSIMVPVARLSERCG